MKAVELLQSLAERTDVGPSPSFSSLDISKAVETLHELGPLGRSALAKELGLGEGAVRTLLEHMKRAGLVATSRSGSELTEKGLELHDSLFSEIKARREFPPSSITVGPRNFAMQIRGAAGEVVSSVQQRDEAVRAGAHGAIVLVYTEGDVLMPPDTTPLRVRWPEDADRIKEWFNLDNGDVLIIAGGDTIREAEAGTRAAALTLVDC